MRKTLVMMISLPYMALGLLNFYDALFPVLPLSGFLLLRLFRLADGVLTFYAGLTMFRLNEVGRKLVVVLASISLVISTSSMLQSFFALRKATLVYDLTQITYRIRHPYAYQIILLVWAVLALLAIIFLLQKKTKAIFVSKVTCDAEPDVIFE